MLGILTSSLFYATIFTLGLIIGGVYTPLVMEVSRTLEDDSNVQQAPQPQTPPARQRKITKSVV